MHEADAACLSFQSLKVKIKVTFMTQTQLLIYATLTQIIGSNKSSIHFKLPKFKRHVQVWLHTEAVCEQRAWICILTVGRERTWDERISSPGKNGKIPGVLPGDDQSSFPGFRWRRDANPRGFIRG